MKLKDLLALNKNPKWDSQWKDLVGFYLKMDWGELYLKQEMNISVEQQEKIQNILPSFQQGKPVAYITGHRFFYKSDFLVRESVFIPRPETEILVEKTLEGLSGPKSKIMDLGSGSGCIGLSIAKELPQAEVHLLEMDPKALELSKTNAKRLSLNNVYFHRVCVGEESFGVLAVENQWDAIVANPPYIAWGDPNVSPQVHDFEPHRALYASENGLYWIHKWLQWGYNFLKEEGFFIFEFGQGQAQSIDQWVKKSPYRRKQWINDYSGIRRFLKLEKIG